ncbi:MAG: putative RING/U-box superfamily protein, partial [Streblomastix strix]
MKDKIDKLNGKEKQKHSHKHQKKEKEQDNDDDNEQDNDKYIDDSKHSHQHKKKDEDSQKEQKKHKSEKHHDKHQQENKTEKQTHKTKDCQQLEVEEQESQDCDEDYEVEEEDYLMHEQQPFTFVKRVDLQKDLDKLISEVSILFSKSADEATLLLIQYNWKTEKLTNAFFANSEICLKSAGIFTSGSIPSQWIKAQQKEQNCPICYCPIESGQEVQLQCGHRFCSYCISMHINTQFLGGSSSISIGCPEIKCYAKIFPSMIRQVLSTYNVQTARGRGRQSQSAKAVEQFNQYIQDNFIESQRNKLCYCINPRCTYVAKCEDPLRYDVNCICGARFCFKCARSNHVPSTCDMMQQWEKMTKSESANFLWIQA